MIGGRRRAGGGRMHVVVYDDIACVQCDMVATNVDVGEMVFAAGIEFVAGHDH